MIDLEGATVALSPGGGRLGFAVAPHGVQVKTEKSVAWLVVEAGRGALSAGSQTAEVDGRDDVFGGTGWSAYLGPGDTAVADGDLRCVVVWRDYNGSATTRLLPPEDITVEERGSGTFARTVRTYLSDGPLIVGETINPAGGWSSYPPHKHDDFEEAYLYRFSPAGGFGLAARYDDTVQEAQVVQDGDVTRIPRGYHPVVAAPGYTMAYTWALAGDTTFSPSVDPSHEWIV